MERDIVHTIVTYKPRPCAMFGINIFYQIAFNKTQGHNSFYFKRSK